MTVRDPHRIRIWQVVVGAVLGWIGGWVLLVVALLTMYSLGDTTSTGWGENALMFGSLLVVPVLAGLLLMLRGRPGLGSGLLLGVAIGSVVGAGVCATYLGVA